MCRAKKEENNGAAPLRSVSGEVFATFASLLLVALVLMCMLQTGSPARTLPRSAKVP